MANNANASTTASALTGPVSGGGVGTGGMIKSPPGGIVTQQQQQNPLKKLQQQLADTESELNSIQRRQQQNQPQPMAQDQAQNAAQRVQYLTSPSNRSAGSSAVDQSTNQQQSQFAMIGELIITIII